MIEQVHYLLFDRESSPTDNAKAVVYDIGCGDGRVLISLAHRPDVARVVGIEYDGKFVVRAQQAAQTALTLARRGICVYKEILLYHACMFFPFSITTYILILNIGICAANAEDYASIDIRHADARLEPANDATHIFCYLTPVGIAAVRDVSLLPLLRRHGRLVTYVFRIPGLQPTHVWSWGAVSLYLYTHLSLSSS